MVKPSVRLPKGRPMVQVGKPMVSKPASKPAKKENPKIAIAREAVTYFEEQYRVLSQMKAEWTANFPKASQARDDIMQQEDIVQAAIQRAKPLVADVKMTIGDFIAQRKWSEGHYDDGELTRLISSSDDGNEILLQFLQEGIVKGVTLDKQRATSWFAQHPEHAARFEGAWKEKAEITTAVMVPKV